ncbi:ABC transporter permease [Maritimibacter alkaliphilus]|uniref:ABC transporter permease n=1 Tax=Maritimibacter alkaliphilus TaxID=404236 RepID=UPI001C9718B1|nr:ABC transporter permease [Maritimibacter alkaliphilus]MBY6089956.1 ABC transporter permease [Maritimibacter alkaliphilus]
MLNFILKRSLLALPTLFLVSLMVFLLVRMIPGDPASVLLGEGADAASIAAINARLGLDQPLPVQFLIWVQNLFRGDLGTSIITREPVLALVFERFRLSATIILLSVGVAALIAVPLGILAAWKQDKGVDLLIVGLATLALSIPSFWLGLMFLMYFGIDLGWAPVVGFVPFAEDPLKSLSYLALPVLTLGVIEVGVLTRMARSSAIEVLRLEYISHAKAKGLSNRAVLLRHVLPNAFGPTLTLIGIVMGTLLGGIAVIETVFTLPGLGRLLVESIYQRDYPVVQGCLLMIAVGYVVLNLIVDLLYPIFDPRVTLD